MEYSANLAIGTLLVYQVLGYGLSTHAGSIGLKFVEVAVPGDPRRATRTGSRLPFTITIVFYLAMSMSPNLREADSLIPPNREKAMGLMYVRAFRGILRYLTRSGRQYGSRGQHPLDTSPGETDQGGQGGHNQT